MNSATVIGADPVTTGLVFNIQRYSLQDGPGIRTTVFLKGCPLNCWWCHNPESQSPEPQVTVAHNRCIHCGQCQHVCPSPTGPCTQCGTCAHACPTAARQMVGQPMTLPHLLAEIRKDRIFYEDSSGGVTFSGGEPLLQPDFLRILLTACHAEGFHSALDTSGYAPQDLFLDIAARANLILYDLKLMDDARHMQYTGVSNARILDNLQALARMHHHIWLRIPIIPTINDDPANLHATARFVASLPSVVKVCLLPYHKTAAAKFDRLGRPYPLDQVEPPSPQHMEELAGHFRTLGINAQIGG